MGGRKKKSVFVDFTSWEGPLLSTSHLFLSEIMSPCRALGPVLGGNAAMEGRTESPPDMAHGGGMWEVLRE